MPEADYGKGFFTRIVRNRGVLLDADQAGGNYKVKLTINRVKPTASANVWRSNPTGSFNFSNPLTDFPPTRNEEGVYTFYDKVEDWETILVPGHVYDFVWCFAIDGVEYTETERVLWKQEYNNVAPTTTRLTLLNLKRAVTRFLGSEPGTMSSTEIVNIALDELCASAEWSWSTNDTVRLDVRAGVPYVELPQNFAVLVSIQFANSNTHCMEKVTAQEMRYLRERSTVQYANKTHFYIRSNPRETTGKVPHSVMEIYPTPSETKPGLYVMDYKRNIPHLSDDTDVVPIGDGLTRLVIAAVRTTAAELEGHEDAGKERRIFEAMIERFKAHDAGRIDVPFLGQINKTYQHAAYYPIDPDRRPEY